MKKAFPIIMSLMVLAVGGFLVYEYYTTGTVESEHIIRAVLIVLGLGSAYARAFVSPKVANKKTAYKKAYEEHIGQVFVNDKKKERLFYNALHDFNTDKSAASIEKLQKLESDDLNADEKYALAFFSGQALFNLQLYKDAIDKFAQAMHIRKNSSCAQTIGLCYARLGDSEKAISAYKVALQLKPNNPIIYNNISTVYFRLGQYANALSFAKQALEFDNNLNIALTTAAICCAMLDEAEFEDYYRRAVIAGANGETLKATIAEMKNSDVGNYTNGV